MRCWSSTRRRGWRRRRSPTSTSRSSTITRSFPVINKVDLPAAEPERVKQQIEDIIGISTEHAVLASAKSGLGIEAVLDAIVALIPPPKGDADAPLKAMLVDSWYDPYLGVVILLRVIDGSLRKGQQITFMAQGTQHLVDRVGCFRPKIEQLDTLGPGEIGFITAQIKEVAQTNVGDTITDTKKPTATALPGFKTVQPVVFCGLFPDRRRRLRETARLASASCASMTPRSASRPRAAPRSASASAAASSDCCTSRSSRSG